MASITQMRGAVVISVALSLFTSAGLAQVCEPGWVPGEGIPGVSGPVNALTQWDPDGVGPLAPRLIAAGRFGEAGRVSVSSIAAWDGAEWSALGTPNLSINAVSTLSNGDLVAGGTLPFPNGEAPPSRLVVFNGSSWVPLGEPPDGDVLALATHPDGSLVVGGAFSTIGGRIAGRIAIFQNGVWNNLAGGLGVGNTTVDTIAIDSDGSIIVGGNFPTGGALGTNNIARWTGSGWVSLGSGTNGRVYAIKVLPNGDVIAGGAFTSAGGVPASNIARWNGSTWSAIGAGLPLNVLSIEVDAAGTLWAGWQAIVGSGTLARLSRWTGTAWEDSPEQVSGVSVRALRADTAGGIVVGGQISGLGEVAAFGVARLSSQGVTTFGDGGINPVDEFFTLPSGEILAIGEVPTQEGIFDLTLVRWTGQQWERYSSGSPNFMTAAAVLPNGDLIAVGSFNSAGGVAARGVARFDGSTWHPMGTGFSGIPYSVLVRDDGRIFVAGQISGGTGVNRFNGVATWNGSAWVAVGATSQSGLLDIRAAALTATGQLVVGGNFSSIANIPASKVALWDDEEGRWSALGSGVTGTGLVRAVRALSDGRIVIGGAFSIAGGVQTRNIAAWDGSVWSPLGAGLNFNASSEGVRDIRELPGGQIVAAGGIVAADVPQGSGVFRWDGASWNPYGVGLRSSRDQGTDVRSVLPLGNGDLIAAGSFFRAGENISARFARWSQSGAPAVALPPLAAELVAGSDVSLVAAAARGTAGVSYRWERETAPGTGVFAALVEGPGGASPGGGVVVGASGVLANPTDGAPIELIISNAAASDSARYRVVLFNACGQRESVAAAVTVRSRCEYDYNRDENIDLGDAQLMAQVVVGLITPDPTWLDGDLNGDGLSDLTDAQQLAQYVISGTCGV